MVREQQLSQRLTSTAKHAILLQNNHPAATLARLDKQRVESGFMAPWEEDVTQITILGLGPGDWKQLTLEAVAALNGHDELWLRTRHHPLVAQMPAHLAIHSFDEWYDEDEDFATLYQRIAAEVVQLGQREGGVLYGVPGHPWVGESTVSAICRLAADARVTVRVIEGLSLIEPALAAVGTDALAGLQVTEAAPVAARYYPPFDGDRPVLIAHLASRSIAAELQRTLMALYPSDHPVTLMSGSGTVQARRLTMPLYQLDEQVDFDSYSALWVPPLGWHSSLPYFQDIIAHLRSPEGCPWDQEQDHASLRNAVLEEAYEVAEAIDLRVPGDLREELGDLLLMIVMHAQIASEAGAFNMGDIINSISEKMIRRHPHVFATTIVSDSEEVVQNWEAIKAKERAGKAERPHDTFDEVPAAFPALLRAQKIAKRAEKDGWRPVDPSEAFRVWEGSFGDDAALGDLLLSLAVQAGRQKQDAESLLREATARLVQSMREEQL